MVLCVDDEGGIWVTRYCEGCVHHYTWDGQLADVAFGGAVRDRLFITAAGGLGCSPGEWGADANHGADGLCVVEPGVRGPAYIPWQPLGDGRANPGES